MMRFMKSRAQNASPASLARFCREQELQVSADKSCNESDAEIYRPFVNGLIFLKHIDDAFQRRYDFLARNKLADPEDQRQYISARVFFIPVHARWKMLRKGGGATLETGQAIDAAIEAIEKANPPLRGFMPRGYARPELDHARLTELIELVALGVMR
jgi:type I restriction enzyme M protein